MSNQLSEGLIHKEQLKQNCTLVVILWPWIFGWSLAPHVFVRGLF